MTAKHRGIQLKTDMRNDEGFTRLLGSVDVQPDSTSPADPVDRGESPGSKSAMVASKEVIARRLREELDDTLRILKQALAAVGDEGPD